MRSGNTARPAGWLMTGALVTALHATAITWLFLTARSPEVRLPDMPPLALTLASLASPVTPPSDVAIDRPHEETTEPAPPRPQDQPDVAKGPRGTLAAIDPTPPADRPVEKTNPAPAAAAAAPPPIAATLPLRDESAAPVEGSAATATAAAASWESQVLARIEKAKRYPPSARATREQDTLAVSFTIDAAGRTSNVRIRRSAGYEELEAEARAVIGRVSPLPPPPDRTARQISVLIDFYLR